MMKIEDEQTFEEVYLCFELMPITLRNLLSSSLIIDDRKVKFIMFQILHGLYYLHSINIMHRDIKPENITLNNKCQVKIIDMNLARKQGENLTLKYLMTRPYRAPQVLLNSHYTKSIDIWSVGCIMAQLLGRVILFKAKTQEDQIKKFIAVLGKPKLQYFQMVDPSCKDGLSRLIASIPERSKSNWKNLYPNASVQALDLLDKMLNYDACARPTAEQCLDHQYFAEFQKINRIKCQKVFDISSQILLKCEKGYRRAIYKQSQDFHKLTEKAETSLFDVTLGSKKIKKQ